MIPWADVLDTRAACATHLQGEVICAEPPLSWPGRATVHLRAARVFRGSIQLGDVLRIELETFRPDIDPPTEGVACMAKLYNADVIGTYNIKDGRIVEIRFSTSDGKIPWVDKGYLPLKLNDINSLEIFANGAKFIKQ